MSIMSLWKETNFRHAAKSAEVAPDQKTSARPALPSAKLVRRAVEPAVEEHLAEYAVLADRVGIRSPDLAIERFKAFLAAKDLPVFSLQEVIAYMDAKARTEGKEGWEWRPLREKDNLLDASFGTAGKKDFHDRVITPASDYYNGSRWVQRSHVDGTLNRHFSPASSQPYDRTIPLHAVRRVALIEAEHEGPVSFFVSDYALAESIPYPDPFLMAVIPNPNLAKGEGRFVIDFWDEPGFGITQMLA